MTPTSIGGVTVTTPRRNACPLGRDAPSKLDALGVPVEVGDVAAWFAAAIATIAAFISMSSANSARSQAESARKQAAEATRQAEAAERQAAAAEEQVALMKQQLEAAHADRRERLETGEREALTEAINSGNAWVGEADALIQVRARAYANANPEQYRPAADAFRAAIVRARSRVSNSDLAHTLIDLQNGLDQAEQLFNDLRKAAASYSDRVVSSLDESNAADKQRLAVGLLLKDLERLMLGFDASGKGY